MEKIKSKRKEQGYNPSEKAKGINLVKSMNFIERIKEALSYLPEDDLILSGHKILEPIKTQIIEEKEPEAPEKLPFQPIRKPISQPLFKKPIIVQKPPKAPPSNKSEIENSSVVFDSFQDIKSLLKTHFKNLKIHDDLPDDKEAKILAKLYENKTYIAECILIHESSNKKELTFLQNLTNAIHKKFASCDILSLESLEKSGELDIILKDKNIRLFIATKDLIWHHPKLLNNYSETSTGPFKKLATKDLFTLMNLEYYLKDPLLKRSLWNYLMAYFKKS